MGYLEKAIQFYGPYYRQTQSKKVVKYSTRTITSRGLYIFDPISEDHLFVFKEFFAQNSVLMYG